MGGHKTTLEKLDLFHNMEVLFPEYFLNISIPRKKKKNFHTMEMDITVEIGFSNRFLYYFHYGTMEKVQFFQC